MFLVKFIIVNFFVFSISFASFVKMQSNAEKKIANIEQKHSKKCKKLYPNASDKRFNLSQIQAFETARYIDCITDYLKLSINHRPKKPQDDMENEVLNMKIDYYNKMKDTILFESANVSAKSKDKAEIEEVTIEKSIIIPQNQKKVINFDNKAKNLSQAKQRCANRGFKEQSLDSLERFLFRQCVEEEGFKIEDNSNANLAYIKKEKGNIAMEKQRKDEDRRKKAISKVEQKEKVTQKVDVEVAQEEVVQEKKSVEPASIEEKPAEEVKMQEKIQQRSVICKIDENKNRVCFYSSSNSNQTD